MELLAEINKLRSKFGENKLVSETSTDKRLEAEQSETLQTQPQ
jgi:hypothetical protein